MKFDLATQAYWSARAGRKIGVALRCPCCALHANGELVVGPQGQRPERPICPDCGGRMDVALDCYALVAGRYFPPSPPTFGQDV